MQRQGLTRSSLSLRERLSSALSGTAALCLVAGGAWYFVSAVWWLLRHRWPGWSWARLGVPEDVSGSGPGISAALGFLAGLSPGSTALGIAAILAIASRAIDPFRRRR